MLTLKDASQPEFAGFYKVARGNTGFVKKNLYPAKKVCFFGFLEKRSKKETRASGYIFGPVGAKKRGSGFLTLSLGHRGRSPSLPPSSFPPCPCQDSLEQGRQGRRVSDRPESVGLWAKFGKVQLAQQRRCGRYRGIVEKVNARLFNLAQPTQHIKKTLCVMSYEQKPTASQHFCRLSKRCSSLFLVPFSHRRREYERALYAHPYFFPYDPNHTKPWAHSSSSFAAITGVSSQSTTVAKEGETEGGSVPLPLSLSIHRFPFPFFPPLALSPRIPLLHPHASQHGMSFAKTDTAKN